MMGNNDILTNNKNIWVVGGKTQDVENSQLNSITRVSHVLLSAVCLPCSSCAFVLCSITTCWMNQSATA